MRPIVHIGVHKTASSWFQQRVWPLVDSHTLIDQPLIRRAVLAPSAFAFDPVEARRVMGLDRLTRPPIVSEEDLSGVLHYGLASGHIARMAAERLHAILPDAQVLIFIRAQPSAAASWYLQYLREGGTKTAHAYLHPEESGGYGRERPFKRPRFDWSQLDWSGLVAQYDALFGREAVHVVPYEALVADRAGLLRDVGQRIGIKLPEVDASRVNRGYRRGLIPLVRAANLFTRRSVSDKTTLIHLPQWYQARKKLFELLNRCALFGGTPGPESLLGQRTVHAIERRFARSNRWLAARAGWDLRSLGYPLDGIVRNATPNPGDHAAGWSGFASAA